MEGGLSSGAGSHTCITLDGLVVVRLAVINNRQWSGVEGATAAFSLQRQVASKLYFLPPTLTLIGLAICRCFVCTPSAC